MNCYWKNVLNFVSILKRMEFLDLEHCTNWLLAFCNPKIHWFGFVRLAYLPQIIDSSWMRDPRYKHEYQCPLILSIEISWSCMYNPYALKACTQRKDCGLKQDLFSHFLDFFFWKSGENPFLSLYNFKLASPFWFLREKLQTAFTTRSRKWCCCFKNDACLLAFLLRSGKNG